jgi:hypothetical protein
VETARLVERTLDVADNERRFSIGSSASCDVVLADDTVAPIHVWLDIVEQGPMIVSAASPDRRTEVVHAGRARAIRKGIVTRDDTLRLGEVEIPVDEVLVALKLANKIGGVAPQPEPKKPVTPVERQQQQQQAPTPPADKRPLTRSLVLPCPACHTPTASLKRHRLYRLLVFIGVAWWAQTAEYTACPPCMRRVILQRTLINIPTANITWPIVLIIHAVHFAGTYRSGHSRKVLELLKT